MKKPIVIKFILTVLVCAATPAFADGGYNNSAKSRLKPYHELIEKQRFRQAVEKLDTALREDPDDPDLLNLLAFSHRNLGHYDKALGYYQQALKIKPKHRGANEYLGELYLKLGQLEKAERRLAVLDKACFFGCDEYDKLKQSIADYRRQNPS